MKMDFKHVGVDIEVTLETLYKGIMEFCDEDDLIKIMDRMDDDTGDWEFTNRAYELFRKKHLEFLEDHRIDEKKYREEYCHDPAIYDDDFVSGDEEPEEPWTTNIPEEEKIEEGALVLGDEEDVDVFSTETE